MGKELYPHLITKKLLPWTFYAVLSLAIFRLHLYPLHLYFHSAADQLPHTKSLIITPPPPPPPPPPPSSSLTSTSLSEDKERADDETPCDYTNGKWVHDKMGPLYNGTTCSTIKEGQNCITHGRPDMGYLYWRWEPKQCKLPRFDPNTFLGFLSDKHLAFVGDSVARNQLESLLCMLSTFSVPNLVYRDGEDNKFRRWHFDSHNVTVSVYWSPFLVKGVEKSTKTDNPDHNKIYVDHVDERWAADLYRIDMIVLSFGHWYLNPAVYFEGDDDDSVLGCHYCPGLNHTEIEFYDPFRKALKTALNTITERRRGSNMDVLLTTFSPSHFEGEWDKAGACPKIKPYKEEEKMLEGMDAEMRKIGIEEMGLAKELNKGLRLEALDVTKLSLLRPDGHPGPYMYPNPFANGVQERVHHDCVHWCLPGPVDTWNQILLEVIRRWDDQSMT